MYVTVQTFCFQALISGMSRVSWEYAPFCEIHTTPYLSWFASLLPVKFPSLFPRCTVVPLTPFVTWLLVSSELCVGQGLFIDFLIHRPQPHAVKSWIGPMRYIHREKAKTPTTPVVCRPQNTLSVHCGNQSRFLNVCFWLRWVFVSACWLFLVGMSWGHPSLGYASFWLQWLLLLWSPGSRAQA